ncbi:MAG TPA: transcription-repair coupling factor, partial [Herpetosiphonaceae bacterium]|nr:transcription-repair coupling factor [Herpetosiphonaceae bacterium]
DAQAARLMVTPIPAAARPGLGAFIAQTLSQVTLLVAPTLEVAARLREDLQGLLGDDVPVLLYPAADALWYEHMSVGDDVIGARLRVVEALNRPRLSSENGGRGSSEAAPVVVAPVKALMQPTLTPAELSEVTRVLTVGESVAVRPLLDHISRLGYRSVAAVEATGEWSSRGGIVDIWPPTDDRPLRIEFFGDEVDSLRRFDPLSQRSERRERQATILPPHEIAFWRHVAAVEQLQALDLETLRPEVRREWSLAEERLEHHERFEGRAFFAPLFAGPAGLRSLLDHLPAGALMLLAEAREVRAVAEELQRQAEETRAAQIATGELPHRFPRPFLTWEELTAHAAALNLVDLSAQPLSPGDQDQGEAAQAAASAGGVALEPYPLSTTLFVPAERFGGQMKLVLDDIEERVQAGERVLVVSPQSGRIAELCEERGLHPVIGPDFEANGSGPPALMLLHSSLSEGWHSPDLQLTLLTDSEIFGFQPRRPLVTKRKRQQREIDRQAFLQTLQPGDYVVHIEHGIAVYEGLRRINVEGVEREYLHLRYAAGDALFVPVDQIDRISKYIGGADSVPALTRLGTADWERVKRKVKAAVEDLARELLELYAARQAAERPPYSPDTQWQYELEESFPYIETDDQLQALAEIKRDMLTPRPMDRLVCGDVGYGKTEVALRAAFKAVQDGKQVAVLVPTTVLAQQHFDTFRKRMAPFPIEIEMLSRFRTPREQKAILDRLAAGQIDIIVGTHRLLSRDVAFKDLGLVVVDEEQRFGVKHKERLKALRNEVDVLTLSATPIPRTLHMALAGMRDLSVIDTPPEDRVPIKTYVVPYEEGLVRDAILRELGRGGQVFFVHNRVQSIYSVAARLEQLVPGARFLVGHGQMEERELERVMFQFFAGEADVLVCTTIIESGLDVPRANTIIIDDATNYGLAQLYQLRGRVGRSTQRAYAYLLYHPGKRMTGDAQQRLQAIQEATELGAGFRIAMRDLEIRGAGNLLGPEQSGNIAAVGFDLYTQLLAQAVREHKPVAATNGQPQGDGQGLRGKRLRATEELRRATALSATPSLAQAEPPAQAGTVTPIPLVALDLPLTAYLPSDYIADDTLRLRVYQKLAAATTPQELRLLRAELQDRFGPPPEPAEHLLTWLEFKALALRAEVPSIATSEDEIAIRLPEDVHRRRDALLKLMDEVVRVGPQFIRINRRSAGDTWVARLREVLETLAGT